MRSRFSLLTGLCLLTYLCLAPLAQATYDPLGSGTTKLTLNSSFLALLKQNKVKLSALAPARLTGKTVSFPVSEGKFDPTAAKGTVEHEGALLFTAGPRSIPIKALQLKTTSKRTPLSAKVGGSQLKLAVAPGLRVTREGFGEKVAVPSLTLSAKLATRLGKKLDMKDAFEEGLAFGKTLTIAQPQTIALRALNKVEFSLAPSFQAKLDALFIAVNPIFGAEHPAGPTFTLPIAGGTIAPDASQGTVQTEGSLEFIQLGRGQVFWSESWFDLAAKSLAPELNIQPSPPYGGKAGRLGVAVLGLTSPASADAAARTVSLSGTLALDAATATTFNEVFAKPQGKSEVFVAGEAIASLNLIAQGQ